jgi:hypothetical protein
MLDVLFSLDGRVGSIMDLKINQTIYPVARGEAFD